MRVFTSLARIFCMTVIFYLSHNAGYAYSSLEFWTIVACMFVAITTAYYEGVKDR